MSGGPNRRTFDAGGPNPLVHRFRTRHQKDSESAEAFITSLHTLSEHCGFGERRENEILYQLIIGIRDAKLSKRLQLDDKTTLEKASIQVRQEEQVNSQQPVVRGSQPTPNSQPTLEEARAKRYDSKKPKATSHGVQQRSSYQRPQKDQKNPAVKCRRCGQQPGHSRAECPAAQVRCEKCHKVGHYTRLCQTKSLGDLTTEDAPAVFLGELGDQSFTEPWMIEISVNDTPTKFKIDTGADVTALPETLFKALESSLSPASLKIRSADGTDMRVLGKFQAWLSTPDASSRQDVYVIRGQKNALLGRPAIIALNLLARLAAVNSESAVDIKREFPKLFTGLGKIPGGYTIKLQPNATPYALSSPRRVPLPLMTAVKEELDRMLATGVISKVDQPTAWCAGMVVRPKPNDRVRICVDLSKLNESVQRERLLLPSVDHTLGQLQGAKFFSKLDANSGFWQISLAEESAPITTFITPFGRFWFNRLPFGITSAPE